MEVIIVPVVIDAKISKPLIKQKINEYLESLEPHADEQTKITRLLIPFAADVVPSTEIQPVTIKYTENDTIVIQIQTRPKWLKNKQKHHDQLKELTEMFSATVKTSVLLEEYEGDKFQYPYVIVGRKRGNATLETMINNNIKLLKTNNMNRNNIIFIDSPTFFWHDEEVETEMYSVNQTLFDKIAATNDLMYVFLDDWSDRSGFDKEYVRMKFTSEIK